MKSKRAGLLRKLTQGNKKNQVKEHAAVATVELQEEKQDQGECKNGACSISWKPAAVSR